VDRHSVDLTPMAHSLKPSALMDENLRSVVSRDNPEPFAVIEPFYRSLSYFFHLLFRFVNVRYKKSHKVKSLCGRLKTKTSSFGA
jgi:hypothetical protein